MDKLRGAFKCNRHRHRDWLIKLVICRHGLRISQTCDLRWDDIDLPKRDQLVRICARTNISASTRTNQAARLAGRGRRRFHNPASTLTIKNGFPIDFPIDFITHVTARSRAGLRALSPLIRRSARPLSER